MAIIKRTPRVPANGMATFLLDLLFRPFNFFLGFFEPLKALDENQSILNSYAEAGTSSLKEAGLISVIDIAASAVVSFAFRFVLTDVLGLILLLEGAVLLLVGGALGFAGQPGIRRLMNLFRKETDRITGGSTSSSDSSSSEKISDVTVAFYMLTGSVLFFESIAMAFLLA